MKRFVLLPFMTLLCFANKLTAQSTIDAQSFENATAKMELENSFVVIGEAHEVKGTNEAELFILEALYEKGYRTVLIEGGLSEALILNRYLASKDLSLLNNTRAKGANYRALINGISELDKEGNMKFEGIDFERGICLQFMFDQWFGKLSSPALDDFVQPLIRIKPNTAPKKIKSILLDAKAKYNEYEAQLKTALGSEAAYLKRIIFNPVFQADFGVSTKKRDLSIAENLLRNQASLENTVLITGSNHLTNKNNFWLTFEAERKENMNTRVFILAYKNCKNFMKKSEKYNSAKPLRGFLEASSASDSKIEFDLKKTAFLSPKNDPVDFILVKILNQ